MRCSTEAEQESRPGAVVADVVDCAKNKGRNIMMSWSEEKLDLLQIDDVRNRFFVRVSATPQSARVRSRSCSKVEIVAVPSLSRSRIHQAKSQSRSTEKSRETRRNQSENRAVNLEIDITKKTFHSRKARCETSSV